MPKCRVKGCNKLTQYKYTKQIYCVMHLARVRRHGYPELKKDAYKSLEKLPHGFVDDFIRQNCKIMTDEEIAKILKRRGYKEASTWTVKYRRRKLGVKKYLYGEVKKHKAWIRAQAIKKYGKKCELCDYSFTIDTHHIIPKQKGGLHEINNLMVVCPNCHALITRRQIVLKRRADIIRAGKKVMELLKKVYPNFG